MTYSHTKVGPQHLLNCPLLISSLVEVGHTLTLKILEFCCNDFTKCNPCHDTHM